MNDGQIRSVLRQAATHAALPERLLRPSSVVRGARSPWRRHVPAAAVGVGVLLVVGGALKLGPAGAEGKPGEKAAEERLKGMRTELNGVRPRQRSGEGPLTESELQEIERLMKDGLLTRRSELPPGIPLGGPTK